MQDRFKVLQNEKYQLKILGMYVVVFRCVGTGHKCIEYFQMTKSASLQSMSNVIGFFLSAVLALQHIN